MRPSGAPVDLPLNSISEEPDDVVENNILHGNSERSTRSGNSSASPQIPPENEGSSGTLEEPLQDNVSSGDPEATPWNGSSSSLPQTYPENNNSSVSLEYPPHIQDQNHYEVLGVDQSASVKDVVLEYKKLSLQLAIDRSLDEHNEDRWMAVKYAYHILNHPVRRIRYDLSCRPSPIVQNPKEDSSELYCEGCCSSFRERQALSRHTCRVNPAKSRSCHRHECVGSEPDNGIFRTEYQLRVHWHESEFHGVCSNCRSDFRSKPALLEHNRAIHNMNGLPAKPKVPDEERSAWYLLFSLCSQGCFRVVKACYQRKRQPPPT